MLKPNTCHKCKVVFLFESLAPVEVPYTCPACARTLERERIVQLIKDMPSVELVTLKTCFLDRDPGNAFKVKILKELEG